MNLFEASCEEKQKSNENKSSNKFKNVKSNYIFKKIYDNLSKKKLLEIIKYNNKLNKRLNLTINDYKDFCEKFSSIEIEIISSQNLLGKYINIDEDKGIYYHLYFNNNKKETKIRNLIKIDKNKYNKIKIIIDYQIDSLCDLFYGCDTIEYISFKKFHRNNIKDMSYMFSNCYSLKEINFSQLILLMLLIWILFFMDVNH